jgi:high-affinity nickel-transport protein
MLGSISRIFSGGDSDLKGRIVGVYAFLIGANLLAWAWALAVLRDQPVLLGTAMLAYTFGLRHAVDADHIAAIDNVTRKLMQQGERPIGVGLFFSLGHSAVVILLSVAVAFAASAVSGRFDSLKAVGDVVGTSISALFLFAIAILNVVVLVSVWRTFQAVKRGEPFVENDFDLLLNSRGLLTRIFRPLFRIVTKSWQMLPIGFLFGLGFDTATEVALFGLSAAEAKSGASLAITLLFPALFTVGMSLIDTTDGVLMLGAYGWAFMKPIRKLYYNITITAVSVIVAVVVGGLEALNLVGDQLGLTDGGGFWGALSWIGSVAIYKLGRYDEIEVKTAAP